MRPQRVVLKQKADIAFVGRNVDAFFRIENDRIADGDPALRRRFKPRDHTQRRRLSAAGRPEQRDEFSVFDNDIEVIDSDKIAPSF